MTADNSKMFQYLKAVFEKKPNLPEPTRTVWDMWKHNGYGNSIRWFDWDKRKITGHIGGLVLSKKIRVGDEIRSKMDSGKIARFIVIECEYMSDPNDQFFATVSDLDYADEQTEEGNDEKSF